ncbi:MAG: hypothetical protein ACJ8AW_12695 [Rhodopila sp.]
MRLKLEREWELGAPIGTGGFGRVYAVTLADDPSAGPFVVKLIPKAPGAQRELLFANLGSARNVVPVIESGETDDSWALVMPKAEKSLRQSIDDIGRAINAATVIPILTDVATAPTSTAKSCTAI